MMIKMNKRRLLTILRRRSYHQRPILHFNLSKETLYSLILHHSSTLGYMML